MASAQLSLLQAVEAALLASPAIAGGNISEDDVPMQPGTDAAIRVRLGRSRGRQLPLDDSTTEWSTQIALECRQRASVGQSPYTAVDALLQAAYTRVVDQATAPNLGSWAAEPSIEWDIDEADTSIGVATLVLTATHLAGASLAAA